MAAEELVVLGVEPAVLGRPSMLDKAVSASTPAVSGKADSSARRSLASGGVDGVGTANLPMDRLVRYVGMKSLSCRCAPAALMRCEVTPRASALRIREIARKPRSAVIQI